MMLHFCSANSRKLLLLLVETFRLATLWRRNQTLGFFFNGGDGWRER